MVEKTKKESQEFQERKELIRLEKEVSQFKHELSMTELKFRRENDRLHHERELERGRIREAETRKTIMLKSNEMRKASQR